MSGPVMLIYPLPEPKILPGVGLVLGARISINLALGRRAGES